MQSLCYPQEVVRISTSPPKKPCFRHNFWTETLISPIFTTCTPPCHTWLESYGSQHQFGTKLLRFEGSYAYRPSEFWWHGGTDTCHWSESLSYIPLQSFPRADHDQMTWRCENWGWILHYCSPCVARWKHWKCNRRNYMFSPERNSEDAHDQLTWSSWLEERCESEYWVESDNAVPA